MGKWVCKPCGSFTDSKGERGNKVLKACNLGTGNDTIGFCFLKLEAVG